MWLLLFEWFVGFLLFVEEGLYKMFVVGFEVVEFGIGIVIIEVMVVEVRS